MLHIVLLLYAKKILQQANINAKEILPREVMVLTEALDERHKFNPLPVHGPLV